MIKLLNKAGQPGISLLNRTNAFQMHLLNQTTLKYSIGSFYTAFGLGCIGEYDIDIEGADYLPQLG